MKNLVVTAMLLFASPLLAQQNTPKNFRIIFTCTCGDATGRAFASAFRERIAATPRYTEVADTSANQDNALKLRVVSLDLSSSRVSGSVMSTVLTMGDTYVDNWIQTCNPSIANSCVSTMFSSIDKEILYLADAYDREHTVSLKSAKQ
jgi:hypothetical protein